jgi:MFS family permease
VTGDASPSDNPFRSVSFRFYWVYRLASTLAIQIQSTALAAQVYGVARGQHLPVKVAALYVGLIGLVQFVPMLLLSLPAGEIADRRNRRGILVASLLVDGACAILFLGMSRLAAPPLWALLAVAALFACARAFIAPASTAIAPMLVSRAALPRTIALNSMAFQVGTIAGPSVAGVFIAQSSTLAYGVALALFLIGVTMLLFIKLPPREAAPVGSRLELMREGLSYVWRTRVLFGAISLDLFAVLLGGATALLPAFAYDVLHVGAHGFGLLRSAPAIGALGMGLYLSRFSIHRHAGFWMFTGVALFGISTIVFGLSKLFVLSVVALVVMGAADLVSVNVRQTLIQIATPDAMRGRVASVSMIFISASNEFGDFESGVVARFLGVMGAAVFGGVGSVLVTGLWAAWFPELRKADRLT